jgi:hypothetical protein
LGPGSFSVNNMGFPGGFGVTNLNAMYPPPIPIVNPMYGGAGGAGHIVKIEKIYNCVIYEKFMNEFKRMLRKYKDL